MSRFPRPLTATPLRCTRRIVVGILVVVACRATVLGQVRFRSGPALGPAQSQRNLTSQLAEFSTAPGDRHIVVQLERPIRVHERIALRAAGVELGAYLADHAYFAVVRAERLDPQRAAASVPIRSVSSIDPRWKLHRALTRGEIPAHAIRPARSGDGEPGDDWIALYVMFHADVPVQPGGLNVAARNGALIHSVLRSVNGLVLELPRDRLLAFAAEDAVQYIEPALPVWGANNDSNRALVGADALQGPPENLDGSGVTVMIYDAGTALATHPDFGGRLSIRDNAPLSDHSTHVAGTVGGNGSVSGGLYRGMAPGVLLESYGFQTGGPLEPGFLFSDPGDLESDYTQAVISFGARLANNSIGSNVASNGLPCEWEGDYGVTGALIDAIVGGSLGQPFRIVWSAGNERFDGRCNGPGGFYTIAPPAGAKNHICVGSVDSDTDLVSGFTSSGPTDDGRIKPDVCAPGCQLGDDGGVTSTAFTGGYFTRCGTSMSAPTLTGICALLLQDFRDRFPAEPDPPNATLKAILTQTAVDLDNPGPDFRSGFGSVRAQPALELLRSENWRQGQIDQSQTFLARILVGESEPQLKVTLAWDDAPGAPNVIPNLVNDLDLQVFDPSGDPRWPWTLDPLNPAVPATRTQPDHVNNIEQVVVDDPVPGAWSVVVHGFNVPAGPQSYTLAGSGAILHCSSQAGVSLEQSVYACNEYAEIIAADCDLNDDASIDTVTAHVTSSSEPGGSDITLTETAAESAEFRGAIFLDADGAGGGIRVSHGDDISATMIDADDGAGGTNVYVTAPGRVDCQAPEILGVTDTNVSAAAATVGMATGEPARVAVRYGTSCGALNRSARGFALGTTHQIVLRDLTDSTIYSYVVDAEDGAGNQSVEPAGGPCRTFSTTGPPVFFTEEFDGGLDLDNTVLTFTPVGSPDFYAGCAAPISELPIPPVGGTVFDLFDDDFVQVTLTGGRTVSLYGQPYGRYFIGSNGYITFSHGDLDWFHDIDTHFDQPRISALFVDLSPNVGGSVRLQSLPDREVITWLDVPQFGTGNQNTFQVHLWPDGKIQVYYLRVDSNEGVAGLSAGGGRPQSFTETDLSALSDCLPHPPVAHSLSRIAPVGLAATIVLSGADDGLPDPPGVLRYVIHSLPAHGSLADPGAGAILSVPYTLSGAGHSVRYQSDAEYRGGDAFQYRVRDGGSPPTGGLSAPASVWISTGGAAWDPVADDVAVATPEGTPVDVVLSGSDPNGDNLSFVIRSLPPLGLLVEPGVRLIGSVPYAMQPGASVVRYIPPVGQTFQLGFRYAARDVSTESETATATIGVGGATTLYDWNMDAAPGWIMEPDWAWGPPTGQGSHNPDPTAGFSGANVIGYNLNGDYASDLPPTSLTTPPLNLEDFTDVVLTFRRWLGVEDSSADHAAVQISTDGATWNTVWEHDGPTLAETDWSVQQLELTEHAAGAPAMYLRWVMGPTNATETYSGWNIDDVIITGAPQSAPLPGDVTLDGTVNLADFATLIACFGLSEPALDCNTAELELCDLTGDGLVNLADFAEFALHFSG